MKNRFKTLFLDIGGVLLSNGWARNSRLLASQAFNLDYDDFNERHHLTFDIYEQGFITLDEYLRRVVFHRERGFSVEQFKNFMFSQSSAFPDTINFIKRIKERYSLKSVAVSNEGRELTEYRTREFNLFSVIDLFAVSCFVNCRKPDTRIFKIALDLSFSSPEEVLYIDDRRMFIEVAAEIGIQGIVHNSLNETSARLESFGLLR